MSKRHLRPRNTDGNVTNAQFAPAPQEGYSTAMPRSPEELARIALDVARGAATLLMSGFRTHPVATEKARANLVTDYDFASERAIRAELQTRTPEISIVAEEEGGQASTEITWYVDPLDGTTNFVHGHPFFCVSIGALRAGLHALQNELASPASRRPVRSNPRSKSSSVDKKRVVCRRFETPFQRC